MPAYKCLHFSPSFFLILPYSHRPIRRLLLLTFAFMLLVLAPTADLTATSPLLPFTTSTTMPFQKQNNENKGSNAPSHADSIIWYVDVDILSLLWNSL